MGKTIKITLKKPIKEEKGQALILVLVLLLLGGLILAPLLGFMSTGLIAGQMHEERMEELYAADAGVEDALWNIKTGSASVPEAGEAPWVYDIASVNGKDVNVTMAYVDTRTYKITSVATSNGKSTTIESYVSIETIWDNAIASKNDVDLGFGTTVIGDIYAEEQFDPPSDLVHDGDVVQGEQATLEWPSQQENEDFAQRYEDEALVGGTHEGDKTIPMGPATVDLGPLYITGNLHILKDNTIVMTGTVYVEGSIDMEKEAQLTGSGSISGSIVAVGDIYLAKIYDYGTEGDATIMSLNGDITFKKEVALKGLIYAPNGTIKFDKTPVVTGAVVGEEVWSAKDALFTYDEGIGARIDLPGGRGKLRIHTWESGVQ